MSAPAPARIEARTFWRRPRSLVVVRDPTPEELEAKIDWSEWYLTEEEDMGESPEQEQIIDKTKSSLRVLRRERGWENVHIAGDQFFAWRQDQPKVRVSPDVYLLDDPPPPPFPGLWETWVPGLRAPRFAIEVVSGHNKAPDRWKKDYEQAPEKYAQLGTRELVIFDPHVPMGRAKEPERVTIQLYQRSDDGEFVRVHSGAGPVYCREIEGWLVVRMEPGCARLRIARDPEGKTLVPTEEELLDQKDALLDQKAKEIESLRRELAALRAKSAPSGE